LGRTVGLARAIEIDVWQGDISELEVDALVVPANESLFMTGGPAAAVKRRAGDEVEMAAVSQGPAAPGTAIVTPGGALAAPYVIHAVAVGHDLRADVDQMRAALSAALGFAAPLQLRRIAISLLGTERGAFAPEDAAPIVIEALLAHSAEAELPDSVVLVAASSPETHAIAGALGRAGIASR
jgi:O-acetyl-ADP-ribose deacetylase